VTQNSSLQDLPLNFDWSKSIVRNYSFDKSKNAADLFGDSHAYNGDENDVEDGDVCTVDDSSSSSNDLDLL
jgi:hypothetical protein